MPDDNENPTLEEIAQETGLTDNAIGDTEVNPSLTPQGGSSKTGDQSKLIYGKYKTPEEAEKGYKSLNSAFTATSQRAKALEKYTRRILADPKAINDPEVKQALGKLGLTVAEVEEEIEEQAEAEQEKGNRWDWDGSPNHPALLMAAFETRQLFKEQRGEIEQGLGRKLTEPERGEIREIIKNTDGRLDVKQAWRISESFEKAVATKHAKELGEARRRASPSGSTRPDPRLVSPGQKIDLNKPVTSMNDAEGSEYIMDIVRRGGK